VVKQATKQYIYSTGISKWIKEHHRPEALWGKWLGFESTGNGRYHPHAPSPFISVTQPESW